MENTNPKKKRTWLTVVVALIVFSAIMNACSNGDENKDSVEQPSVPSSTAVDTATPDTPEVQPEQTDPESVNGYTILHGTLLDANPNGGTDGTTLVIKTKITSSWNNKMTIDQNYFNIEDIVKNQNGTDFQAIDYWAVADMADGSESKVISFLVNTDVIAGLSNGSIAANQLGDYVEDLYILPSLLE